MATYYLEFSEAVSYDTPAGTPMVGWQWNVTEIATARGWTLGVDDVIFTPAVELEAVAPFPVDRVVFIKRTDTSNPDIVFIRGDLNSTLFGFGNSPFLPRRFSDTGNIATYAATAANNLSLVGNPVPVFAGAVQIKTGVPPLFYLNLLVYGEKG